MTSPLPLQSFLVAQGLFSFLPLLLFASFVFGTVFLAAISALLFSLFWAGVAALVLGGTLFVTSGLALLAWAWVVGAYLVASFAYGLVFAGDQAGVKDEEQRLLREKWTRIVKAEPGPAVNGTSVLQGEKENGGVVKAGENEGADGGL